MNRTLIDSQEAALHVEEPAKTASGDEICKAGTNQLKTSIRVITCPYLRSVLKFS